MADEKELEAALLEAYERAKNEERYIARRFKPYLRRHGTLQAAKNLLALRRAGMAQTGFDRLVSAGRGELTLESIVLQERFRQLFTRAELHEARRRLGISIAPDITAIAQAINEAALDRPIGTLQQRRAERRANTRIPSLFDRRTIKPRERYAYHVGGQTELQFNIGFESRDDGEIFRHGVAFSLETSRSMHSIDPLKPKIEKFNEFLRLYPEAFAGLSMWYWSGPERSDTLMPTVIPPELITLNMFIFLGAEQPALNIDIDWVLDDFDRLLPLYEYVEGSERVARPAACDPKGFTWSPGNAARQTRTSYSREAGIVDRVLRHNELQAALFTHLERLHGNAHVSGEQNTGNGTLIDVAVRTPQGDLYYYEIKTGLSAQSCIREAMGQLMEYSYWPGTQEAVRLIIVGEPELDADAKRYLATLRKRFSLAVHYEQFDLKQGKIIG